MNVAIIVIDTLRYDAFGDCIGNIPELNTATVYANCYSAAPWTLPSCASILTGYYPTHHNLYNHTRKLYVDPISKLLSKNAKYKTFAVTNNSNFSRNIGYQDLFDRYYYFPDGNNKVQKDGINHESPFKTAEKIVISEKADYLLFLHTNIVHDYYLGVNKKYSMMDGLVDSCEDMDLIDGWELKGRGHYLFEHSLESNIRFVKKRYMAGVNYVNIKIRELISKIDMDNTMLIIVGDHGEGFDPKNYKVHHGGRLHDDLIHVPLLISYPNSKNRVIVNNLVSTTDIVPTIVDYLKISAQDNFDGQSLLNNFFDDRSVYSEDPGYLYIPNSFERIDYKSNRFFGSKAVISNKVKIIGTSLDLKWSYSKFDRVSDLLEENPCKCNNAERDKIGVITLNLPESIHEWIAKISNVELKRYFAEGVIKFLKRQ